MRCQSYNSQSCPGLLIVIRGLYAVDVPQGWGKADQGQQEFLASHRLLGPGNRSAIHPSKLPLPDSGQAVQAVHATTLHCAAGRT